MSNKRFSSRAGHTALALAMTVIGASYANAASLLEVYDLAAQSDPVIRAAEAARLAARESRPQAWAAFLPNISANAGWSGVTYGEDGVPATTLRGGTWGISAVESFNLPNALRALNRTDYTLAQADLVYHAAELNLVSRVATRYFNVLSAKDTLSAAQSNLDSLNQQLERAEKRFEVGLSAITDVQEARAQRDRATATVISAKRTLATNQELLREVTGAAVETLAAPIEDMPLLVPEPQNEDAWVQKALDGNLTLASDRISLDTASYDVGTQKLTRWPTISVGANYRNANEYDDFKALGANNTTNSWDGTWLSLGVTLPLFTGGMNSSKIRQAVYQQRAARERVEQTTRETERAARDAYLGLESAIAQVSANRQALESARLALQATEAGFDVGTRTTIDVLASRNTLLTAEQSYALSRYNYIQSIITLKVATGSLTREDLQNMNRWLTE